MKQIKDGDKCIIFVEECNLDVHNGFVIHPVANTYYIIINNMLEDCLKNELIEKHKKCIEEESPNRYFRSF